MDNKLGKALGFFSTQRINLRKVKVQKEDGITEDDGIKINVKIAKNRCAYDNPYKATSYTALFGQGIDKIREIAQLAEDMELVEKGGAWYNYPTKDNLTNWNGVETKFQGKAAWIDFIRDNQDFQDHLLKEIRQGRKHETLTEEEIQAIEAEEQSLEAEFDQLIEE